MPCIAAADVSHGRADDLALVSEASGRQGGVDVPMNTLESCSPRPKLAPMALKAFYFIGMAAIVGWSLPKPGSAAPAGPRAELAMQVQMPDGEVPATAVEAPASVPSPRNARSRVNCEGCGVIESVRRIDTRDEIMEWCAIGDTAGTRVPGNLSTEATVTIWRRSPTLPQA